MEARVYRKAARKLIECEERSKLIRKMIKEGVGFREEEQFLIHEKGKLKGNIGRNENFWRERKKILALIMERKLKDKTK